MYFELAAIQTRTPLRQPLRRLWTHWSHLLCSSLWCDVAKLPLTQRRLPERVESGTTLAARLHSRIGTPCGLSDHLHNGPCSSVFGLVSSGPEHPAISLFTR